MSNELAVQEQRQISPMDLIQMASAQGATIDQMAQLFELKLRVDADEARKAYSRDFSAFKAEAIRIVKGTKVVAGPLKDTKYANLFDVVSAVTPALSKFNLSHSWKLTKDEKDWMEVTCTISHSLGHSESVSMGAAPDSGPGRNAIQARGSAKTYLERYTLLAATGLTASDSDDDGQASGGKPQMAAEVVDSILDNIRASKTHDELKRVYLAGVKQAQEAKDKTAEADIIAAKNTRYKQLPAVTV